MPSKRILFADHDPKMVNLLRQVFTGDGYGAFAAVKGEQAVQMAAVEQPDLIVLDVALPGEMDGYEVLRRVREFSDVPVVLLSTCADTDEALRGYRLGADDYIIKPFDPKILLARVRVLLKRSQGHGNAPAEIVCRDLVIDQAAHRVTRSGSEIYLTETEYNLLVELARHQNRVLMHDQLLVSVWGSEYRNEVGYLRSYIHILRRKLESDPSQPRLIISRPGVGYMLMSNQNDSQVD